MREVKSLCGKYKFFIGSFPQKIEVGEIPPKFIDIGEFYIKERGTFDGNIIQLSNSEYYILFSVDAGEGYLIQQMNAKKIKLIKKMRAK